MIMFRVTTVGFGDQVPSLYNIVSFSLTVIAMVLGSLFLSMPLAIIGNNYQAVWKEEEMSIIESRQSTRRASEPAESMVSSCQVHHLGSYMLMDDYLALSEQLVVLRDTVDRDPRAYETRDLVTSCASIFMSIKLHARICAALEHYTLSMKARDIGLDSNASIASTKKDGFSSSKSMMNQMSSLKQWIWDILENPLSSKTAMIYSRITLCMAMGTIAVFYSQTMPELHDYGQASVLCKSFVQEYCHLSTTVDPGCVTQNEIDYGMPLRFDCDMDSCDVVTNCSRCYGVGDNFGSASSTNVWNCAEAFNSTTGMERICERRQCDDKHERLFDPTLFWTVSEWVFGVWFTLELILRLLCAPRKRDFFSSAYNMIDIFSILPFIAEVRDRSYGRVDDCSPVHRCLNFSFGESIQPTPSIQVTRPFGPTSI